MTDKNPDMPELSQQLLRLAPIEGFHHTAIDGVVLMRMNASTPPIAVLQEPTIVIVAQGLKRGYIGKDVIHFQAGQCLIVSVPMPFDCDTVVNNEEPMLALAIKVDIQIVSELITKTSFDKSPKNDMLIRGMTVTNITQNISEVAIRLLNVLSSNEDTAILGNQIKRELIYRIMQSPGGELLKALVAWSGRFGSIYQACEQIQRHYSDNLNVKNLAKDAGMSVSAFHQAFKMVTDHSPIQYLKITRLHKARELILNGGRGAAQAAYEVGYLSASQFSREFKRLFGYPPGEAHHYES